MYRDLYQGELAAFAKHVQIAETLYVVHVEQATRGGCTETRHASALSWIQLWEQLAQARAIAQKRGRDVSGLDAARRRGNPAAVNRAVSRGHREAALRAFAEVRRCLPEVVIPTEIREDARPTPRIEVASMWLVWALGSFLVWLLVAPQC